MGKEASAFNQALVESTHVRLELDVEKRDQYGRLLAYAFVDTVFVNAELVRQGLATVYTVPPNVKYADLFVTLQQEARETERGLWDPEALAAWHAQYSASDSADVITVYVTKTGNTYHRAGCPCLRKSKIPVSLEEAQRRDYSPCSRCKPLK
jgi:micrococcal nuclease